MSWDSTFRDNLIQQGMSRQDANNLLVVEQQKEEAVLKQFLAEKQAADPTGFGMGSGLEYNQLMAKLNSGGRPSEVIAQDLNRYTPNTSTGVTGSASTSSFTGGTSSDVASYSPTVPDVADPQYDEQIAKLLANPDLTADQKTTLQTYYNTVATNDQKAAAKMVAVFNTGIAFSSPIFKAQVALVTDALSAGLKGISGDLAYKEQQLAAQKAKLESDLGASNEMLDFNSKQQLENLKTSFDTDIQTNADNMAATGKASSSVRLKSDALLNQNYSGLVESTNKTLAYNKTKNINDTAYDVNQTNQQLSYYQDKATADRIAALRDTEAKLGSGGLSNLGYTGTDVLGNSGTNINSTIEADRLKDAFSFAGNFF